MAEPSLAPKPPHPEGSRRRTKTAWVFRHPPTDPVERIGFRLMRMRVVLLYHLMKDLATLHREIEQLAPAPEQRRRWQRDYRALMRELADTREWARQQRIGLRARRAEAPATAWLRRQLATLKEQS